MVVTEIAHAELFIFYVAASFWHARCFLHVFLPFLVPFVTAPFNGDLCPLSHTDDGSLWLCNSIFVSWICLNYTLESSSSHL